MKSGSTSRNSIRPRQDLYLRWIRKDEVRDEIHRLPISSDSPSRQQSFSNLFGRANQHMALHMAHLHFNSIVAPVASFAGFRQQMATIEKAFQPVPYDTFGRRFSSAKVVRQDFPLEIPIKLVLGNLDAAHTDRPRTSNLRSLHAAIESRQQSQASVLHKRL